MSNTRLSFAFDPTKVDPESKMDPIPAGWYNVKITDADLKPTKDGSGQRINVTCKVIDGEFAGRIVFDGLNIINNNAIAQEISQKRLSAYCHATNTMNITDMTALYDKPFKIQVAIKAASGDYDAQNTIKAVKSLNEGPTATATATAGKAEPDWAKAPAPATAAPAPAAAPATTKSMTAKAAGASYESFVANGWTDEAMVTQGYMVVEKAAAPSPPPAGPTASAKPPWEA